VPSSSAICASRRSRISPRASARHVRRVAPASSSARRPRSRAYREARPNRVEILEPGLDPLRLRHLGDGGFDLLGMAPGGLPERIETGVERGAFGFGAGLRPAGGGEVGLGLTARLAGLPVGMVEVGKALDPDLVRPAGGRCLCVGLGRLGGQGDRRFFCSRRRAVPDTASAAPTANPSQRQRSPSRLTRR
jgi:hypothetical protein